jgi:ABC-type nitrate/sulfonate/bicarbonate transport system substrate-binding protein
MSATPRCRISGLLLSCLSLLTLAACTAPAAGPAPASRAAPSEPRAGPASAQAASVPVPAAPMAREKELAKVIVTSISVGATPNYLARDLGFWAEEGIDAELVLVPGAATPAQALVAGEVQFVAGAGATTVPSALEGAGLTVLAVQVNTFPNLIMAPAVQRMEDLKGKRLGITRRGAASDFAARFALRRFGLQPDDDVAIIQLGDGPATLTGMTTDAVDAGVLGDFQIVTARAMGYHELSDVSQLGVEYAQTGQVTATRTAEERPDYVRRFLRGWTRGLAYFVTNREGTLPLAAKYLQTDDMALLDAAYRDYLPRVQRIPYPRPAGIQTVLDTLVSTNPRAATARPEQFYTDRFIRELDESGYFKTLYGE